MSQLQVTGEAKIRDIQGPVVANSGVITALDGAASQYVRGDGALADFPTSTGGGSSVSYYLNSSVSQGTIGGVAYRELSKEPIIGAGTDISISANGYIASYITDANDPALLEVPGGNFNCELYFSVNSNAHNPYIYAELYKYDGTTFTLLGSSVAVPEYLTNGTTISPYYFAIPVPTSALTITDRLAIRIYANVDTRTVTLHTENSHLCQVVTTFSKGLTALNNLTKQVQYLATGTSGTNFNIVSSGDTHTFNLPVASATNTGKLSNTDWSTFNNKLSTATAAATYVPYTGATTDVNLGVHDLTATGITANSFYAQGNGTQGGYLYLKQGIVPYGTLAGSNSISADGTKYIYLSDAGSNNSKTAIFQLGSISNNIERTFTLPDASGTIALTSNIPSVSGTSTYIPVFTGTNSLGNSQIWNNGGIIGMGTNYSNPAFYVVASSGDTLTQGKLAINTTSFSGTSVLQVNGAATLTGNLTGTSAAFSSFVNAFSFTAIGGTSNAGQISLKHTGAISVGDGYVTIAADSSNTLGIYFFNSFSAKFSISALTNNRTYTLPDGTGTLALTSNLSAYLPLTGGTLTGALNGTSATFSGQINAGGSGYAGRAINGIANNSDFAMTLRQDNASGSGLQIFVNQNSWGGTPFSIADLTKNLLTIASTGAATFSSSVNVGTSIFANNYITDPTTGNATTNGTVYAINGASTNNSFGIGLGAVRNGAYDMWFQTGVINGGGYRWYIGTSEKMTMSNTGNVGIGTSSFPTSSNRLLFLNAPSGAAAQFLLGENGTSYAYLAAYGGSAELFTTAAIPLIFGTSNTERMRITSTGLGLFGLSSDNTGGFFQVKSPNGRNAIVGQVSDNLNASLVGFNATGNYTFYVLGGGQIYSTSTSITLISSDRNLKTDIKDYDKGLAEILAMKPRYYKYKDNLHEEKVGFIAQEMDEAIQGSMIDSPIGNHKTYNVEWNPLLVKAIQDQTKIIKDLEARILTLESKIN